MEKITPSALLVVFLCMAGPVHANPPVTQAIVDGINQEMDAVGEGPRGCTDLRERMVSLRLEHPQFNFYFAARNDDTPTGIRGCGYGFHTDDAMAKERAMTGCKQWEVEFGTDGGTKVCRLIQ